MYFGWAISWNGFMKANIDWLKKYDNFYYDMSIGLPKKTHTGVYFTNVKYPAWISN